MKRFEYKCGTIEALAEADTEYISFREAMRRLGAEGWELVTVMPCSSDWIFYFKRELADDERY